MDKYDKAIKYLSEHPEKIYDTWNKPGQNIAGCLFQYAGDRDKNSNIGCLTLIRRYLGYFAETDSLTEAIRSDSRIPADERDIKPENLPVFAEWQRRLDKELGRE